MTEVHTIAQDIMSRVDPALAVVDDDIAATIASRICHDLISPLGAIANGVELLALSGAPPSPEMELIAQSVDSANARIRFFRIAFGAHGTGGIGRSEVTRTLAALSRNSRITYDWTPSGEQPRSAVRMIFLLMQCLESAMPAGGSIRVRAEGDHWDVVAEAPRLRIDPATWDSLGPRRAPPPASAAPVQFGLLATVLSEMGRRLDLTFAHDRISARL